jgi:uncharacterized protein
VARKASGWLLALCLLGSLSAQAADPVPGAAPLEARSLVWAIRGEHNTVFLAGSIHVLKPGDATLPAAFDHAYARSQALMMELDLSKLSPEDVASWLKEHGKAPPGTTLRGLIGEKRYQRLLAVSTPLHVPPAAFTELNKFAPWVLGLELLHLQYSQLGYDPEQGVEEQLERRAHSDGKPTLGLETLAEQLGVFESLSKADQARFLDLVIAEIQDTADETDSLIQAWRSGDAEKLAALLGEEYDSFPLLYRALVTERNQHWVPQIEQLLKQKEENYFVVVGALHLVGKGGLLERLRQDGYQPVNMN